MWLTSLLRCRKSDSRRARRDQGCHPNWRRRHDFALRLEFLDDRTVPSTFTVDNLADSGPGSLRQAILDANALPGADPTRLSVAAFISPVGRPRSAAARSRKTRPSPEQEGPARTAVSPGAAASISSTASAAG